MKLHFRQNLIYLRKRHGYSQITLADEIGVSRSVIGAYEEGRSMPPAENLIRLADLFGVTVDAILRADLYKQGVKLENLSVEERLARIEVWISKHK